VAPGAGVPLSVYGFEHKWLEYSFAALDVAFPVLTLPPAEARSVVLAVLLEQVARNSPYLVVEAASARLPRDAEYDWSGDQLRSILLKQNVILLDEPTVITNQENVFHKVIVIVNYLHGLLYLAEATAEIPFVIVILVSLVENGVLIKFWLLEGARFAWQTCLVHRLVSTEVRY
jgi:hypothetical protein